MAREGEKAGGERIGETRQEWEQRRKGRWRRKAPVCAHLQAVAVEELAGHVREGKGERLPHQRCRGLLVVGKAELCNLFEGRARAVSHGQPGSGRDRWGSDGADGRWSERRDKKTTPGKRVSGLNGTAAVQWRKGGVSVVLRGIGQRQRGKAGSDRGDQCVESA